MESIPHTPLSQTLKDITGKATKWTPKASASTPRTRVPLPKPALEPLSPVLVPTKLPVKVPKPSNRQKDDLKPPQRGRPGRARAGSTASSAVAASVRSQSVMSLDNESHSCKVKQESATPRAEVDGDTTADESTSRRRGRGLMSSPPRRIPKRKRELSVPREPPGPPTHVQWTRNFPKISAQALEHIGAHRNANLFATPLKEKDAPGYRDIILRPQDLKSIKSAINAGARAGNAILATMEDTGASVVSLPISEELIPPKGIVNNAQLDMELHRMFANAIMYNPDLHRGLGDAFLKSAGGDGEGKEAGMEGYEVDENKVVKDTRVMESDVDRIVGEMRSAERKVDGQGGSREESVVDAGGTAAVEDDDLDELAGVDVVSGEQGPPASKRKRRV